jgi:ubiquitin-protein ligase
MFDLINIFDVFLPQLLLYPNPADPLNAEAASWHMKNQEKFKEKVGDNYLAPKTKFNLIGLRTCEKTCNKLPLSSSY